MTESTFRDPSGFTPKHVPLAALSSGLSYRAPTARQRKCLAFIAEHIHSHGTPPTLREIGAHMCIRSTNGVSDHLRALERKGFITHYDNHARGIRLTKEGWLELGYRDVPLDASSSLLEANEKRLREQVTRLSVLLSIAGAELKRLRDAVRVAHRNDENVRDLVGEIDGALNRAEALGFVKAEEIGREVG